MGRAIVRDPKAFLMDEPLSNLDAKLRVQMRTEVSRIQKRLGTTMVYVTHDQTEAMTLGDRVAVMRAGVIQQVDSPKVLYEDPVNLFVAGFIGSPAMNFLPATLDGDTLEAAVRRRRSCRRTSGLEDQERDGKPRDVIAGMRPEHFEDAAVADERQTGGMKFKVTIDVVESMGSELYAYFDVQAQAAESEDLAALAEDAGLGELPGARLGRRRDARRRAARLAESTRRRRQGGRARARHLPDQAVRPRTAAAASPPSTRAVGSRPRARPHARRSTPRARPRGVRALQ